MADYAVTPAKHDGWGNKQPIPVGRHRVKVGVCKGMESQTGNPIWEIFTHGVEPHAAGTLSDRAPLDKVAQLLEALGFDMNHPWQPEDVGDKGYECVVDVQEEPGYNDPTKWYNGVQAYLPGETTTTTAEQTEVFKAKSKERRAASAAAPAAAPPAPPSPAPGAPAPAAPVVAAAATGSNPPPPPPPPPPAA